MLTGIRRGGLDLRPLPFRIFLASPGDVAQERQAVRDVIELLRGDRYVGSRVRFELVAWDQPGQGVAMQAPIFFGRGPEIDQLIQSLSDPTVRFLAVVGVSGSGKSSPVAAGVIPRLRSGLIAGAPWRDLIFKPGERGERDGGPFLALAYALKAALGSVGRPERELAPGGRDPGPAR